MCPPFKYKPAGWLGFPFHFAFMASVRFRYSQRVSCQSGLNLDFRVVNSPNLLCAGLVKHARFGNDFLFSSGVAFNVMEWFVHFAGSIKSPLQICLQAHNPYKRGSPVISSYSHSLFFSSLQSSLLVFNSSESCLLFIMEKTGNFKNALLGNPNPSPINALPSSAHLNSSTDGCSQNDPPHPPSFPETVVLDSLPQVQKDMEELSKTCLFGKILSAPLDLRTIIARSKADWKIIKGEVNFMQMGNGWILLRFANPQDLSLIWEERPWHIQGDLFVLSPWKPFFDPYLEEIKWVDLWVRIPRLPTELLNFDSIANLLASNDIGALIKIDQRSLLRNKIRFARACVRVDIQGPLLEFAEVSRIGDLVHGYIIWYEDFSSGCSFCGESVHVIEACPLLTSPKKEVTIQLLKNPKQKTLYDTLAKATGQACHATTAEQANVVHVKPKFLAKTPVAKSLSKHFPSASVSAGLLPTPAVKGVVIHDFDKSGNKSDVVKPAVQGKGKGKMVVAQAFSSDDSSGDEDEAFLTRVSSPLAPIQGKMVGDTGLAHPPMAPSPVQVFSTSDLFDDNQFLALTAVEAPDLSGIGYNAKDAATFCIEDLDDVSSGENNIIPVSSFQSIHSGSSIVKQIERLGVDAAHPVELSSPSGSAKRRVVDMEDEDDASSALKRKRN